MHPSLKTLDHRPWPLPTTDWKWRQSWLDLAFLHYRVDATELRKKLPGGVDLQEFDGSAWVGIVPFRMAGVLPRLFPDLPLFNSFPELNLRTYVEAEGKSGVWFFSLDADCWPIVWGGRWIYDLPYFQAEMTHEFDAGWYRFTSRRHDGAARFAARYRPVGDRLAVRHGSFEHWATERYCLYAHSSKRGVSRVEVHHPPWPLQAGEIEIEKCEILAAAGIQLTDDASRCHFSAGVRVISFSKEEANQPVETTPSAAQPSCLT